MPAERDPLVEALGEVLTLSQRLKKAEELLRDWRRGTGSRAFHLTRDPEWRARGERLFERTDAFLGESASGQEAPNG